MPTLRPILEETHRLEFESPPVFNTAQRKHFFQNSEETKPFLRILDSATNQVGFLIQLGYFRATRRFFPIKAFRRKDVEYIRKRLRLLAADVDLSKYAESSARRHKSQILHLLQIMPFQGHVRELCQQEAGHFIVEGLRLPQVFGSLCDFIRAHRMEIPAYSVLQEVILQALRRFEQHLQRTLAQTLLEDVRRHLDALMEQITENEQPIRSTSPLQLTHLKGTQELMGVKAIRQNVANLLYLKSLYQQCLPTLQALSLSEGVVEDNALQVMRSRSWQVKRWANRDLYLLCFVQYQYFYLGDVLTKTFLSAVEFNINQCEKKYKVERQERYEQNLSQLADILQRYLEQGDLLDGMQGLTYDFSKQLDEKFKGLQEALRSEGATNFLKLMPMVRELYGQTTRQLKDRDYFDQIARGSQKLQTRVADIMRHLEFSFDPSQAPLEEALLFFQRKDGHLFGNIPIEFLKPQERSNLYDSDKKLRVSLYKSLLARHLIKGLRSGSVFVKSSHLHKSVDDYLINEHTWQTQKQTLLERASMRSFEHWGTVKADLQTKLATQFEQTFSRINSGENLWVEKRKDGSLRFKTPVLSDDESPASIDLYPQNRYVSLFEILDTVNRSCHFLDVFQAARHEHQRQAPADELFFAGIIGMGCNLTTHRVAKTSKNISSSTLETTIRNYFNSVNLLRANDRISALMEKLNVSGIFRKNPDGVHTSSDGQKFTVGLDSIHSTYSSKYFGKEKGITIYSFISEIHNLFYSTAFSASDREAWHVIDGLVHNDVVRSQIHSTDSHGITDPVYAVSYLLSVDFQPRFSELHRQKLHGMEGMSITEQSDFLINAGENINTDIIEAQWDRLLRLVTSIKLKHTMASLVMKRLNSYALQNPLYQAMKELGKVLRTLFILRYMDDETMRQRVHQQQEKVESAHALSRVICYGNNGVLQYANHEELLTTQGCKRLIENAVICWNYLYLTRLLIQATPAERKIITAMLPNTSPVAWQHINFHGEFNFEEDEQRDRLEEVLETILNYGTDPEVESQTAELK